jgi:hypothetical protein
MSWFRDELVYEGRGRAEFLDPHGVVEGPTVVKFDEQGNASAELVFSDLAAAHAMKFGLWEFFSRGGSSTSGSVSLLQDVESNPCNSLTVTCSGGIFSATKMVHYDPSFTWGKMEGSLTFRLFRSQFDESGAKGARYWVLPLWNFVSECPRHLDPEVDAHPLRLQPPSSIPSGLTTEEIRKRTLLQWSSSRIIPFEYKGKLGFIEPLPEHDERVNMLQGAERQFLVTSIMVGEILGQSIDFDQVEKWFPFDFCLLLGLSTGSRVTFPWIEFRDSEGNLVRRIHANHGAEDYFPGYAAIVQSIHQGGIGRLLSQAQKSSEFGQPLLGVAMMHLVLAARDHQAMEDRLGHLCSAMESLCQHFELSTQKLLDGLDSTTQGMVMQILQSASDEIRRLANEAASSGDHSAAAKLSTVADRIRSNAANIDRKFGLAVMDLLKRFNLPDSDIINAHYRRIPRPDGRNWADVLSMYRGITAHGGYFDFTNRIHDPFDALRIAQHLQDLLLRIVLTMVGYDGNYNPPVSRARASKSPSWVTTATTPKQLGYG